MSPTLATCMDQGCRPCASILVLTGVSTSTVVLMTAMTAADLDFDITVLSDGCFDSRSHVHDLLITDVFPAMSTVTTAGEWVTGLVIR